MRKQKEQQSAGERPSGLSSKSKNPTDARILLVAILIMGASGIIAQVLLLRELLVAFYGNELTIGIILSNWVMLEACGAFFLGRAIERIKRKLEFFVLIQIIFSISFLFAIYLTRILKEVMGLTPGVGLGLLTIIFSSFLLLLPTSICHGALFTFGCKIYSFRGPRTTRTSLDRKSYLTGRARGASSIGMVYVYETLGAIIGGVLFTYILIPYLHSFQIAFAIVVLNLLISLLLLGPFWRKGLNTIRRALGYASAILLVLCAFSFIFRGVDFAHKISIERQWKGRRVMHYQNSIYSNIVVTKREKQYTFYSDGIPIVTTPTPDITFVEEFANFPMLSHPSPQEILIISGGAGGLINELLKHPVERIDYVELDPLIIELIKKYPTPMTDTELSDPRVDIKNMDGRLFIRKAKKLYDIILMGITEPSDLQTNRLFTEEFFRQVKRRLREGGIFAFTLPGSYTYINQELIGLNVTVINALKNSFRYTKVIPGDFNLLLSSDSKAITEVNPNLLIQRAKRRNLSLRLFKPQYLNYRMDKARLRWFHDSIKGAARHETNRDFHPLAVFYSLAYWNAQFSPYLNWFFRGLTRLDLRHIFICALIFITIVLLMTVKIHRFAHLGIPYCIATSGFAGMLFDLLLILSFQILYGYAYQQIGLLVTAFMAGAVFGGLAMTRLQERLKNRLNIFLSLEIAVILFSIVLPIVIYYFNLYLNRQAVSVIFTPASLDSIGDYMAIKEPSEVLFKGWFLGLCMFSGLVVGLQFPLANRIYLGRSDSLSHVAGLLYGADLFGGWLGGMIGGLILLPLLGLAGTCLVLIMLKISSLAVLVATKRVWA